MDSLKEVIESILFVAGEAVEFNDIASKLNVELSEVKKAAKELQTEKEKLFSGIQIQIFNSKAQLCSNPNYAEMVSEVLNPIKEKALTKAVLEVAAICAYKQPITRLEIEQVRGVNSDYAVNVLIENNLIEVVGRKDAIGKPLMYGTTDLFLKRFNIESIDSLPDYEQLLERIKIIKNPDNSLFDFSNIPPSDKEPEEMSKQEEPVKEKEELNVLHSEAVHDDELAQLEKEIDKETIHEFFNTLKEEPSKETKVLDVTEETPQTEQAEEQKEEPALEVKEDDIDYKNLVSILDNTKELVSDSDYSNLI